MRRCRHERTAGMAARRSETFFNARQKIRGVFQEFIGQFAVAELPGKSGARPKARDGPKIVPIKIIVRAEMFGAKTDRQQSEIGASLFADPFRLEPRRAAINGPTPL